MLLFDAGGYFSTSSFFQFDKGVTILRYMTTIGYDVVGLASSEFWYGPEFLYNWLPVTGFDVVCCNLRTAGVLASVVKKYVIRNTLDTDGNNMTIAVLGYSSETICSTALCGQGTNRVSFDPVVASVLAVLKEIAALPFKVDLIIALSTADAQVNELVLSMPELVTLGLRLSVIIRSSREPTSPYPEVHTASDSLPSIFVSIDKWLPQAGFVSVQLTKELSDPSALWVPSSWGNSANKTVVACTTTNGTSCSGDRQYKRCYFSIMTTC